LSLLKWLYGGLRGLLTGLLPASPVRKGGVKGSYTKMAIFLTGEASLFLVFHV
jgi:hypothetical protein